MDLFAVKRFYGDDEDTSFNKDVEEKQLCVLQSKIEDRKRQKRISNHFSEDLHDSVNSALDISKEELLNDTVTDNQHIAGKRSARKKKKHLEVNNEIQENFLNLGDDNESPCVKKKKPRKNEAMISDNLNVDENLQSELLNVSHDRETLHRKKKKRKREQEVEENCSPDTTSLNRNKRIKSELLNGDSGDHEDDAVQVSGAESGKLRTGGVTDDVQGTKKRKKKRKSIAEDTEETNEDHEGFMTSEQAVEDNKQFGRVENSIGFTVIGSEDFAKKQKVHRVLPRWLTHPSVVSSNLQNLDVSVDDIPGLHKDLIQKLKDDNITHFFPVQQQVIPWLLESQKNRHLYWPNDVCVSAPTGSGKTFVYVLPIIQALKSRIVPHIRALVMLPVRDLAVQVHRVFLRYCEGTDLNVVLLKGDDDMSIRAQEKKLLFRHNALSCHNVVDIIVATPGRLVDHIMNTKSFSLKHLEYLVIDEADSTIEGNIDWMYHLEKHLDSFHPANARVKKPFPLTITTMDCLKPLPQKLLFSATLTQDPEKLAKFCLFQPKLFTSVVGKRRDNAHDQSEVTNSEMQGKFIGKYTTPLELQEMYNICEQQTKPLVLFHLIQKFNCKHALCFTNTNDSTRRLCILLNELGAKSQIEVRAITTSMDTKARQMVLKNFDEERVDIIVCTDALARGMDLPNATYVFLYDVPSYVKKYIHRIGRTARAGKKGVAITLLVQSQFSGFCKMLKEAGKEVPENLEVEDDDIIHLEEEYKNALSALKTQLQEKNEWKDAKAKKKKKKKKKEPSRSEMQQLKKNLKRKRTREKKKKARKEGKRNKEANI